jgi:GR25 family glycosyltransferase involved in LPS biosynthesis
MHGLKSENVLIFEDDVLFTDEAVESLSKSVSDLSGQDWDMFYLGVSVDAGRSNESPAFERITNSLLRCKNCQCLHAVAYNTKILPHLLKMVPDKNFILNWLAHNKSIDWWIMENIQENFNVFCTDPMIATQRPSFSNIDNNQATWGQNLINTFNDYVPPKFKNEDTINL